MPAPGARVERDVLCTPAYEAAAVFHLVERGVETLESARGLIGVPDRLRQVLAIYARSNPTVQRALAFRLETLRQFNLLASFADAAYPVRH